MVLILEIFFSVSALLLMHSFLLYPLLIWILSLVINRKYYINTSFQPQVSILISAFNEEKVIEKTIRSFLKSNYDQSKIEFIIGSDNSTDSTDDIIVRLQKEIPAIKFFPFKVRRGKSQVLNDLVKEATSEILIFSDANTIYEADAIRKIVRYYSDERVGGVSGRLVLTDDEKSREAGSQEVKYWDAESWLKDKEGMLGILIGANGGIYSVRKQFFVALPLHQPVMDDFYISMKVLEQKKYFLYVKDAIAEEVTAPTLKAEFNRKIRNNSLNLSTVGTIKKLLLPSYGLAAFGLWSHKIIRWYTPVLLIIVFITNLFLLGYNFFYYTFIFQIAFYLLSLAGYVIKPFGLRITPLLMCFYFTMTNIAMFIGIIKYFTGRQRAFWQSTPR